METNVKCWIAEVVEKSRKLSIGRPPIFFRLGGSWFVIGGLSDFCRGCIGGEVLLYCGRYRFRFLRQAHDALVRNFPTKVPVLAPLFQVLLQENGASRITDKRSGGR